MRGYFEIGVFNLKTGANLGTLWRSAYQLGAAGIFTIGRRYHKQSSDVHSAYKSIPLRSFLDFDSFLLARPTGAVLVGVETGGVSLSKFRHPERAVYLLGAEDVGLPQYILEKCQQVVTLDTLQSYPYNLAVAGSIVMYHRTFLAGDKE